MKIVQEISARGHRNITASHKTTLEFTKNGDVSEAGDCIVAVSADKGAFDLSEEFKEMARSELCKITVKMKVGDLKEEIFGRGHPKLTFKHPHALVIRKSNFVCDRTLMINANKSASDLKRNLVKKLQDPEQVVRIQIVVEL